MPVVIPTEILDKSVTVERADSVPDVDWAMIDEVVERYLERMQSIEDMPAPVATRDRIEWVTRQVIDSELYRRLAPMVCGSRAGPSARTAGSPHRAGVASQVRGRRGARGVW